MSEESHSPSDSPRVVYCIAFSNYDPTEIGWIFASKELRDKKLDEITNDEAYESGWGPLDWELDDAAYLTELKKRQALEPDGTAPA